MQAVMNEPVRAGTGALSIRLEWVAYAAVIALALILRLAELDSVPLTADEARRALAAWRVVYPDAPGTLPVADSPLLFALHSIGFMVFGGSEGVARVWTALAGVCLVASPLLFRDVLGRVRTFLFSLLLLCSPVLLAASRLDTPAVWALLAVVIGLWGLWRWWQSEQKGFALLAAGSAGALLLLTDPAGFILALVLLGAGVIALGWGQIEGAADQPEVLIRARLSGWPWQASLLLVALAVVAVSTLLMAYLPGLSTVSELLGHGMRGFVMPRAGAPPLFSLVTSLFYEPLAWGFGIASLWLMLRRDALSLVDRFFAAWLVLAGVSTLLYRGFGPEHALWLIFPALGLTSWVFGYLLEDVRHPFLLVPRWSKWLLVVGMLALLAILTINLQGVGRSIIRMAQGSPVALFEGYIERISMTLFGESSGQALAVDPVNMIWALLALALIVLGGFMATSLWGAGATLRGGALGLLLFGMVTSLGSGWWAAVTQADNPAEMWHSRATARETFLLRDSLTEISRRESRGLPHMPVYVLAADDGVVAWLLRDYINATYIAEISEARQQGIVLLPLTPEPPQLGGDYVGQDFIISRGWNPQTMQGMDFLPWWMQRRVRLPGTPTETLVLWLRQDIYNGVPLDSAPRP